jgi:DNA polymerase-3 subunit delta
MKWDVDKALKKPVILLTGEEGSFRRKALKEILAAAAGGDDFDLETFVADSSSLADWLASAGTAPFLSPRRTAVVRNVLRSEAPKDLKPFALPDTALLVLVGDDESGDFDKQKRIDNNRKNWEKAVAAAGGEVLNFTVDSKDLVGALETEATNLGKKLNPKAAETLREMTGGNFSRALEELEKLALYTGSEPQIRESDVRTVVLPSPEWNVYKIVDAITRGDGGEALRQLKTLVGNNTKVEDPAFRVIFPTLSSQLRLLWQARLCIDAGTTPSNAPAEILACFPDRPNLAKEQDWRQKRAMQTARAIDLEALAKIFMAIADADARLKGLLPSFNSLDSLERMITDMVHAVKQSSGAPKVAVGGRR